MYVPLLNLGYFFVLFFTVVCCDCMVLLCVSNNEVSITCRGYNRGVLAGGVSLWLCVWGLLHDLGFW